MKKILSALTITFLTLVACGQNPKNTSTIRQDLGSLEVAFSDVGVAKAWFSPSKLGIQGAAVDESLLTFTSNSQAAFINSVNTDSRIIVAKFNITNASGASINRLTLVAWALPTNINESAINSITNFGGQAIGTTAQKNALVTRAEPVHAITGSSPNPSVDVNNADLQLFSESENTSLETLAGLTGQLLPYGFVARNNSNTAANRRIVNASNANTDGQITIALRVPSNNNGTYAFRMTFRVFSEPTTKPIYVQSLEEQNAGTFGGEAVSSLPSNASLRILPGGSQDLVAGGMVNTRIAGTRSNVKGVVRPWLYKPTVDGVSAGFSEIVTPSGLGVQRSQGPNGALEPVPTTLSSTIKFLAPSTENYASNEPLLMNLKGVQDRDGFSIFPSLTTRGYHYAGFAPDQGTCSPCGFIDTNRSEWILNSSISVSNYQTHTFANLDDNATPELIETHAYVTFTGVNYTNSYTVLQVFQLNATTPAYSFTISGTNVVTPFQVLVRDWNSDGKMDILMISEDTDVSSKWRLDTWLNTTPANGAISFSKQTNQMPVFVSLSTQFKENQNFAVSDFNQDGKLDLLMSSNSSIQVVQNNGDGSFGLNTVGTPPNLWASITNIPECFCFFSFADVDNDGDMDVSQLSRSQIDKTITYQIRRFNTSNGSFVSSTLETFRTFVDSSVVSIYGRLMDINNDGYADLITNRGISVTGNIRGYTDQLEVYLNDGTGGFPSAPSATSTMPCKMNSGEFAPLTLEFFDFDHDQNLDLLFKCSTSTTYGLAKSNGDGTFSGGFTITPGAKNPSLVDWDNDLDTDIVFGKVVTSTNPSLNGIVSVIAYPNR
jgi:hypothetical protein